jgi:hypothetical protein
MSMLGVLAMTLSISMLGVLAMRRILCQDFKLSVVHKAGIIFGLPHSMKRK